MNAETTRNPVTKTLVWDLPTRAFHWLLALSFFGAYALSESERLQHYHVMFGYTVLALTAFRLLWGFIGTRYARFRSFAFGPKAVAAHVSGLLHRKVEPHAGHTPAGSWAIYAMFALAVITAASGYLNFNDIGGDAMEEVHEVAANLWMLVVFVHVAGVIVSSIVERQNLPRSMITGYKRLDSAAASIGGARSLVGVAIIGMVVGFWALTAQSNGANLGMNDEGMNAAVATGGEYALAHHDEDDDD